MPQLNTDDSGLKSRLTSELRTYGIVTLYLFVCFSVIFIYATSLSKTSDLGWFSLGLMLGKALVIGKFVLIGEALKTGTRVNASKLVHRVALRSIGMLVVLVILTIIEELIIGLVHGNSIRDTFSEVAQQSLLSFVAPALLMLLILIPLMTVIEFRRVLGADEFRMLLKGQ